MNLKPISCEEIVLPGKIEMQEIYLILDRKLAKTGSDGMGNGEGAIRGLALCRNLNSAIH